MKKLCQGWLSVLTAFAMVLAMMGPISGEAFAAETEDDLMISAEPGEIIVIYDKACGAAEQAEIISELDDQCPVDEADMIANKVGGQGDSQLLQLETEDDVDAAIEILEEEAGVVIAQPNYRYSLMASGTPDPKKGNQYYLGPWDSTFENNCGANVEAAQALVPGGGHVTVAVLDTGCRVDHPDLAGNIDSSLVYNAYTGASGAAAIADGNGHGTGVSGVIGAVSNNGVGISGVGGNHAKVLPINVFDKNGGASTATIVAAYDYLEGLMGSGALNDLHVINMSLGGYAKDGFADRALELEISRFKDKGVLTVCAGGNGDIEGNAYKDFRLFPGDYEDCLCVTSLAMGGYNSTSSDYSMDKDISAPGESIYTTYKGTGDSYAKMSGTSLASPIVAGVAGLMWAADSSLTVDEVVGAMLSTAHPVNPEVNDWSSESGSAGAIDAEAALKAATGGASGTVDINSAEITFDKGNTFTYNGNPIKPAVSVKYNGQLLAKGTDYTVQYSRNMNAGQAKVSVTGIGTFQGTKTLNFTIEPKKLAKNDIHLSEYLYEYNGSKRSPIVYGSVGNQDLIWGSDFTVFRTGDAVNPGWVKYTIVGKGNCTGEVEKYFRILPKGTSLVYPKAVGATFLVGSNYYTVTSAPSEDNPINNAKVSLAKTNATKSATVPNWVSSGGHTYRVCGIKANAFYGKKKLKTVTVKSTALTKAGVKSCFTGSKVSTVKIKVGTKASNKSYKSKYKSFFAKANSGRKVRLK